MTSCPALGQKIPGLEEHAVRSANDMMVTTDLKDAHPGPFQYPRSRRVSSKSGLSTG